MNVMAEGDIVNVAVWESDKHRLGVLRLQPVFRIEADPEDVEGEAGRLSQLFSDRYGTRLLCTEDLVEGVDCLHIELVRNQEGRVCIRCSIADDAESRFGTPMLVETVAGFHQRVGLQIAAQFTYSAIIINDQGRVTSLSGASTEDIPPIIICHTDIEFDPHTGWERHEFKRAKFGHPISTLFSILAQHQLPVVSNLGRWYAADKGHSL